MLECDRTKKTCSQLEPAQYRFCPEEGKRKRLRVLFYGSYLLPYNSEIKLVHIEEVELQSAVIDFPLRG